MAKLDFPCPACGKWIAVPEEYAGKKGKCPACKQPARVPARSLKRVERDVAGKGVRKLEVAVSADLPDVLLELALAPVLDWVTKRAAAVQFEDGQTMQLGFTLLRCQVKDGRLTLLAPDMRSMPIAFHADLTYAVWALFKHKEVPPSFGEEPEVPSLRQAAVVGPRYAELPCLMERSPSDGADDSGWTFNSVQADVDNNDPAGLGRVSLYEAVVAFPHFLRYLSLPPGFTVLFDPRKSLTPIHYRDRRLVQPQPGSYLAETLEAELRG